MKNTRIDYRKLPEPILFIDSHHGIYIPQMFEGMIRRDVLSGCKDEDLAILEAGPDHPEYEDAWTQVLDDARITDPDTGQVYFLATYEDPDIWLIPEEVEDIEEYFNAQQ